MIITISGKARAGKDTVAELLKDRLEDKDLNVLILHNADYLKFVAKEYFGWNGEKDERGRTLLQVLGTDVVRRRVPDMWVGTVSKLIKGLESVFDVFIVPDCRFENEVGVLEKEHRLVKSVHVKRTGNWDNGLSDEQKNHLSETSMEGFNFDYYLEGKDILELKVEVAHLTEDILKVMRWEN